MKKLIGQFARFILALICVDLVIAGLWAWGAVYSFEKTVPRVPIAVVLFSDFNEQMDGAGRETQRRLNHAVELYDEEMIEYI